MTRRSRADMIEETRAKLLASARHAFATRGYAHTSMDELTAGVGLTRGALYHHFGNKEGLLLAVIGQIEAETVQRLKAVSDTTPGLWERFRHRCRLYLELALEPEIRRILLQDARAVFGSLPKDSQSAGIDALQASLQALMDAGIVIPSHAGALARMLDGAITEAAFWIAEPDSDQASRLAQALAGLEQLLNGLLLR